MHPQEVLFIIELIFWPPTLGLALFVAYKQGFSRQLGWFSLILLGTFRIIGAATGIGAILNPDNGGLIETSMICESVGLISLVGALTGLIFRVQRNLPPNHSILGALPARLIHLATMAALVMSILAGSDFSDQNSASDQAQGRKFIKIAIGLLSGILVFSGGVAVFTRAVQMRHITAPGEPRLVNCTVIALPLIAVRLIYAWLGAVEGTDSVFNIFSSTTGAVVARSLMQVLVELVVTGIFLWAGMTVPKSQRQPHHAHEDGGYGGMRQTRGGKADMLTRGMRDVWGSSNATGQQNVNGKAETTVQAV